ncbi:hypothetical protein Tco_1514182 [Tanacetum coccineum]
MVNREEEDEQFINNFRKLYKWICVFYTYQPPSFLPSLIRPPRTRAAMAQMRAAAPSTYHPLLSSGTPPLLPIPLLAPSTIRRANIPEADTPPRKRLLLTAPRPGYEVGESSVATAARQPGPTMAHRVDCSSVGTVETRV